jgi:gamma-carbonic anhydrase
VRGDVNAVTIGDRTSIGDRSVVHVAKIQGDFPTYIGNHVTVGACALVHAATLNDGCLIGESAQVLDGSVVGSNSIIAPSSVVTPGTTVPAGELWAGAPAKKVRALTEDEMASNLMWAVQTASLAAEHALEHSKSYEQLLEEEELADIEEYFEESAPKQPERDAPDVLGQGRPGRIFRSTLSHPEDIANLPKK